MAQDKEKKEVGSVQEEPKKVEKKEEKKPEKKTEEKLEEKGN